MISNYAFRRTNFQEARLSYEVLELDHPFRSTIGRLALVQRFDFLFMVFDLFSMYRDEQLNLSYLYLPRVLCNQSYIFFQVVINLQWKEYNFHTIGHIINLLKGGVQLSGYSSYSSPNRVGICICNRSVHGQVWLGFFKFVTFCT